MALSVSPFIFFDSKSENISVPESRRRCVDSLPLYTNVSFWPVSLTPNVNAFM